MGYGRYETDEQLIIIREILRLVEPYVNFFQPVMKLKKKIHLGSKTKKMYDIAKNPYQRVLELGILSEEEKEKLKAEYETLNPVEIKRQINKLTEKLNRTSLPAGRQAFR